MLKFLTDAVEKNASDIFIIPGLPLSYKINGKIIPVDDNKLMPADSEALITALYELSNHRSMDKLHTYGDDDLSCSIKGVARFRVSIMKQRGSLAAVIRVVHFEIPRPEDMNIPPEVIRTANLKKGLVLVTGAAGSGKSTTLACIIDEINRTRNSHIITLEDPIEYLYRHSKSLVNQREIGLDTRSYAAALRAALREGPDVILEGEMRDLETISTAITAAETGHLVFSTLHTIGAASTIDRIIDVFPAEQKDQIRVQLSMVMEAVISQRLLPKADGSGRTGVFEVMHVNTAVRSLIRDGKTYQIPSIIQTNRKAGMITMDDALLEKYRAGIITRKMLVDYAVDPVSIEKRLLY